MGDRAAMRQGEPAMRCGAKLAVPSALLSLRLFAGLDDIVGGGCEAWNRLLDEPGRLASLTDYPHPRSVRIS